MNRTICFASFFILLSACSSEPQKSTPDWTQQPTRTVDHGYLVYVGSGQAGNPDKAAFKAEGMALQDLANECSLIPKGTRLEDRSSEHGKYDYTAYVKVAVEFQDCEEAKKAMTPENIKKIANRSFSEQLKRYQDLEETGDYSEKGEVAEIQPPEEFSSAPEAQAEWTTSTHFYVTRQYVAYQKEIVILSPPTAYAPNSPESKKFVSNLEPVTRQIHQFEEKNPELKAQPLAWSRLSDRPRLNRPAVLSKAQERARNSTLDNYFKAQHPRSANTHRNASQQIESPMPQKKKHHSKGHFPRS